jgi:hypothetical protein
MVTWSKDYFGHRRKGVWTALTANDGVSLSAHDTAIPPVYTDLRSLIANKTAIWLIANSMIRETAHCQEKVLHACMSQY